MKKITTVLLFFIFSQISYSQVTGGSAIMPGELAWKAGIGGGFVYGFSSGTLTGDCGYEFEGLKGPGFNISASGSMPIDFFSDLYVMLGYQSLSLESTVEMKRIKSVEGEPVPVVVNMESKAAVSLSSLNLDVYYKRKIADEFFVIGGFGFHIIASNEINQDETIKDDNFVFYGSEKTTDLIYKGEIEDINSLQISGRIGMGYDFSIGPKYLFTPTAILDYPFTKLTSSSTVKILSFALGLQLSYVF